MKVWIDISSPPHANFFRPLIKEYESREDREVLVTARDFGAVTDILDSAGISYTKVGEHGGENLKGKLVESAHRIEKLAEIVDGEKPDVGIGKHSVEGPRVAFGLGIPWATVLDHETAEIQNKLLLPTSDAVICPEMVDKELLKKYTTADIVQFHGVFEYGDYLETESDKDALEMLGLKGEDVVLVRAEPYLSSHVFHESDVYNTLEKLLEKRPETEVIYKPRSEKDKEKFSELDVTIPEEVVDEDISPLELYPKIDLMLGAGCAMNREACMSGVPTVSMYPDDLPAPDRFLIQEELMNFTRDEDEALDLCLEVLRNKEEKKKEMKNKMKSLEDPYKVVKKVLRRLAETEKSKSD